MVSTFSSLEVARRALFAQQSAIQTTGHNVANANTDGYSRQRVNLTTTAPYPSPGFDAPQIGGQLGTGVDASSVQRIRDSFIDLQVRNETTKNGYWSTKSDALSKMESLMNEPSDQGLSKVLDNFWQSLQDLSDHPQNDGARSVVLQDGKAVTDTFHYLSNSLTQIQGNVKQQLDTSVKQINSIADQINNINKQIAAVEPHGFLPNDLYDKRDHLVDQLSAFANVKVTKVPTGGDSKSIADGKYTVQLLDQKGNTYTLVDGQSPKANQVGVSYDKNGLITQFTVNDQVVSDIPNSGTNQGIGGKLQGLIDSYSNDFPNMVHKLDELASGFANKFNDQQKAGYKQDGTTPATINFFSLPGSSASPVVDGAAKNINVNAALKTGDIAASGVSGQSGDNSNATALSNVITDASIDFTGTGNPTQVKKFYQNMIGDMGVNAQQANRMSDNTSVLKGAAKDRRSSVSGVSIDQEMTNLIQYQHAYSASAKMISVINQMLDTIVNQMGR